MLLGMNCPQAMRRLGANWLIAAETSGKLSEDSAGAYEVGQCHGNPQAPPLGTLAAIAQALTIATWQA